jgi:hypothetical protein
MGFQEASDMITNKWMCMGNEAALAAAYKAVTSVEGGGDGDAVLDKR